MKLKNLTRRGVTVAGALAAVISAGAPTAARSKHAILAGVNLSGPEFSSGKLPGRDGWDYKFPKPDAISYYRSHGMSLFRLPLSWERLQPSPDGPLDAGYLGDIKETVTATEQAGGAVILDIHNYGKYRGQLIGSPAVPVATFIDVWSRLAGEFGRDKSVYFGLMNEPQLASATDWATVEQKVVDTLREQGAVNTILVSGINWDGAHNFPDSNGDALARLHDPRHHLLFEAHQYFDSDSSGRSAVCVPEDQVVSRLSPFVDWLQVHHAMGVLGEFGVSRDSGCLADLKVAMRYIESRPDVWYGWTYWAGGPMWGNYMYTLEPTRDGQDRPQMSALGH